MILGVLNPLFGVPRSAIGTVFLDGFVCDACLV